MSGSGSLRHIVRFDRNDPGFIPLCACAALVLGLMLQFVLPGGVAEGEVAPLRLAHMASPSPAADYPAVLAHPIFAPDRAPESGETAVAAQDLTLLGVAVFGSSATALVKGADGTTQRVAAGGTIDGWHLVSIDGDHVTLERNGLKRSLLITPGTAVPLTSTQAEPAATADDDQTSNQDDDLP